MRQFCDGCMKWTDNIERHRFCQMRTRSEQGMPDDRPFWHTLAGIIALILIVAGISYSMGFWSL